MMTILESYLRTAIWAGVDDEGESLDKGFITSDFTKESVEKAEVDITRLMTRAGKKLVNGLSDEEIGQKFWLARNGSKTAFHDRKGTVVEVVRGDRLQQLAEAFPESSINIIGYGKSLELVQGEFEGFPVQGLPQRNSY